MLLRELTFFVDASPLDESALYGLERRSRDRHTNSAPRTCSLFVQSCNVDMLAKDADTSSIASGAGVVSVASTADFGAELATGSVLVLDATLCVEQALEALTKLLLEKEK